MKGFLLIILSCRVLSYAFPIFPKIENATEEIKRYENISNLLMKFCGADDIEELHSDTLTVMNEPRFGFLNVGAYSLFPRKTKWLHNTVTYSFRNIPRYLNSAEFYNTVAIAFNLWSGPTPLIFVRVSKNGNITISFYGHDHHTPFTQPVLAYAHAPGKGLGGDVFLNGTVKWTMDNDETFTKKGINVLITVVHEIGHALGVGHSNVRGAVMNKAYTPSEYIYAIFRDCTSLQLHEDDIAGIQALYGPPPKPSKKPNPVN